MSHLTTKELLDRLEDGDECSFIEAKRAEQSIGDSFLHSVCSLSNQPGLGGGHILLGISKTGVQKKGRRYRATGVDDPDKLQIEIASKCRESFNIVLRPEITSDEIGGKTVLNVKVSELPAQEKPVYLRKLGLPRGAYLRIGATDQSCTESDYARLVGLRGPKTYDAMVLGDTDLGDIDPRAITRYRRIRRRAVPPAPEIGYEDVDLLRAIGAVADDNGSPRLTLAGLLAFGSAAALKRIAPMHRIDYIAIDGPVWTRGEEGAFQTQEFREPLLVSIPKIANQIIGDLPTVFALPRGRLRRKESPTVPLAVIREALVNAVMHREYRARRPIQVIRYSNRVEIRNAGASLISEERLGTPASETRNEILASILHETRYAENKGTGIRTMREQMAAAKLSPPLFKSDQKADEFTVELLTHHFLERRAQRWLGQFSELGLSQDEQRAILLAREVGYIDNSKYRSLNHVDTLEASSRLRHLRDLGLFDSQGKGSATIYVPTRRLGAQPSKVEGRRSTVDSTPTAAVTPEEAKLIRAMGKRTTASMLRYVILRLCQRRSRSAHDLSRLTSKSADYISRHAAALVESGELARTIPETPTHQDQAYFTLVHTDLMTLADELEPAVEKPPVEELPLFRMLNSSTDSTPSGKRKRS